MPELPLPFYRKRQTMPGPVVGYPLVLSWGPYTSGAGTPAFHTPVGTIRIPGKVRLMAVAWQCSVTGSGTAQFRLQIHNATTVASTNALSFLNSAAISLIASPEGIAYYNATGNSFYIVNQVGDGAGGAATTGSQTTYPESTTFANDSYLRIGVGTTSTAQINRLCVQFLCWPTQHAMVAPPISAALRD